MVPRKSVPSACAPLGSTRSRSRIAAPREHLPHLLRRLLQRLRRHRQAPVLQARLEVRLQPPAWWATSASRAGGSTASTRQSAIVSGSATVRVASSGR